MFHGDEALHRLERGRTAHVDGENSGVIDGVAVGKGVGTGGYAARPPTIGFPQDISPLFESLDFGIRLHENLLLRYSN